MKCSMALLGWLALPILVLAQDHTQRDMQMETNGFQVETEHTFLPYQYFIVFTVKKG